MPITANPVILPDSTPTDSTSPDGHIRAIVDDEFGGVLLLIDYSLPDPALSQPLASPFACTLYRETPDGTISRVRGGDPYRNYGGSGALYDNEGPLNTLCTYWAVPVLLDGTDGPPCAGVQVMTSNPRPMGWLISPADPNKSVNLWAVDGRKGTYSGNSDIQKILGGKYPAMTLEPSSGMTTSMQILTTDEAEFKAAKALFDMGTIFRKTTSWERPDGWFNVGDVSFEPSVDFIGPGYFLWTASLTEIDRPATAGQYVSIPGHSFKDRLAEFKTFNDVTQRQFGGNLLLENDSDFEGSVAWAAANGNTTVSQDVTLSRKNDASMKLVATAAGNTSALAPYNVPVVSGELYEFTVWGLSVQGGRTIAFEVDWKDSANTYLGFSASVPLQLGTFQWTSTKFTVTAPAGATQATLILIGTATAASDQFNFDIATFGPLP